MQVRSWARVILVPALIAAASAGFADESETADVKIARAMRAAPPSVAQQAMVHDVDGTMLRAGTNGWMCMPGAMPGDDHPMCNDAVWMKLMDALSRQAEFKTDRIGISYMLAGDANVNNADPFDTSPDAGEVWVQEGPHLMIVVPDPAMLAGISDDPNSGGPYVMWKDTPYAHIMVPVAPRPK